MPEDQICNHKGTCSTCSKGKEKCISEIHAKQKKLVAKRGVVVRDLDDIE